MWRQSASVLMGLQPLTPRFFSFPMVISHYISSVGPHVKSIAYLKMNITSSSTRKEVVLRFKANWPRAQEAEGKGRGDIKITIWDWVRILQLPQTTPEAASKARGHNLMQGKEIWAIKLSVQLPVSGLPLNAIHAIQDKIVDVYPGNKI